MVSKELEGFLMGWEKRQLLAELDALQKTKYREIFIVAFCGVFSAGKSSIINELLMQNFKLPTGIKPITKFITRIEYGEVFQAYYLCDDQPFMLGEGQAKEIIEGRQKLPEGCSEIILKMPAEILKKDMVFLDTPGYEDDDRLEEVTKKAVRSADVAVFCCHADHFGRRFEQEYFQELEDSLGNFCVVINHTDVIHTDEDYMQLQDYVKRMVSGRGKNKLRLLTERNVFYTVGAGKYADLDGLDQFLMQLRDAQEAERDEIAGYADEKKLGYGLRKISDKVEEGIHSGQQLLEEADEEIETQYKEKRAQYEQECRRLQRLIKSARSTWTDLLNDQIQLIENELRTLESNGEYKDFVTNAKMILKSHIIPLGSVYKLWMEKEYKGSNQTFLLLETLFSRDLISFTVPAPKGEKVKKLGIFGSLVVSVAVSTVTGSRYWDDGYVIEYHGYAQAAVSSIKNGLLPKLKGRIEEYLALFEKVSEPRPPLADTELTDKISQNLEEWKKMKKEIEMKIEKIQEKLKSAESKAKRVAFCGNYCVGKSTLINALTRSDILATSIMPHTSIPTIVTDSNEDKILLYYKNRFLPDGKPAVKELTSLSDFYRMNSDFDSLEDTGSTFRYAMISSKNVDLADGKVQLINLPTLLSLYPDGNRSEQDWSFMDNIDAWVFVISATTALSKDEKEMIDFFVGKGHIQKVFFVFNKVNLLQPEERTIVEDYAMKFLQDVFKDKGGIFNQELYNRRVFFVDAYGSMNTRLGKETSVFKRQKEMIPDHKNGVPELEQCLYEYLGIL